MSIPATQRPSRLCHNRVRSNAFAAVRAFGRFTNHKPSPYAAISFGFCAKPGASPDKVVRVFVSFPQGSRVTDPMQGDKETFAARAIKVAQREGVFSRFDCGHQHKC